MRSTEVADRPFSDGEFTSRDIGDRWRYAEKEWLLMLDGFSAHMEN